MAKKTARNEAKYGPQGSFRRVLKSKLLVDNKYQRLQPQNRMDAIASAFEWIRCGTITVVKRADGMFAVVDGGTRRGAIDQLADVRRVPAMVWDESSLPAEARLFLDLNGNRWVVPGAELVHAASEANDPVAVEMLALLDKHDLAAVRLGESLPEGKHRFRGFAALKRVMAGGDADAALAFITSVWPGRTIHSYMLHGVDKFNALCTAQFGKSVMENGAVAYFQKKTWGFEHLRKRADDFAATGKTKRNVLRIAFCTAMVASWNDGHRTRKLMMEV